MAVLRTLALAAIAILVSLSPKAEAAPVGACYSSEAAVLRTMTAEHMHTYAIATTQDTKGNLGALEIFANEQGDVGYVLSSDEPFGSDQIYQPGHSMCIDQSLTNVTLFDARLPGVPEGAKLNEDPAIVEKQCQPYGANCTGQNEALQKISDSQDAHVMVQGTIVQSKFSDANRSTGDVVTLIGRVSQVPLIYNHVSFMHPGILAYSTPQGASLIQATTQDTAYGDWAINKLENK